MFLLQEIHGKSFDIITAKDTEGFTKDTWFNVKPGKHPQLTDLTAVQEQRLCCNTGHTDFIIFWTDNTFELWETVLTSSEAHKSGLCHMFVHYLSNAHPA